MYESEEIYYFNVHRPTETILDLQHRYEIFGSNYKQIITEIFESHGYIVKEVIQNTKNFGTGHVIFFVDTTSQMLVFRGNVCLENPEYYMTLEKLFIEYSESVGFPTNPLLIADTSRSKYNFDYQISPLLPGYDTETEWEGTQENYEKICRQLGEYVAKEYMMPVEGWGRFKNVSDELIGTKNSAYEYLTAYLDYDLGVIEKAGELSENATQKIRNHFQDNKYIFDAMQQAYLVHHDIPDHNVRYSRENYDILAFHDWESAVAFDPICELGAVPTWKSHHPKAELMKQGFLDTLGYTPEYFEEKIAIYFLRTMIWKIAFAIKGKRLGERHKQLFNLALEQNNIIIDWKYHHYGLTEI